jgi:hypothetical protein
MRFRVIAMLVGLAGFATACGSDDLSVSGSASGAAAASAASQDEAVASTTGSTSTTTVPAAEMTATTAPAATTVAPARPAGDPAPTTAPPPPPTAPVTTVPPPPPPPPPPVAATGKACIVSLHGKGGGGQGEWTGNDGVRHSFPGGNAAGWGGRQWLYYPESGYQEARNIVANDVAAGGCGRVIVYGFSNGAAFAAKLYCRGETFGGTVVGYVIDDPVVDHAVEGCARPPVKVVLYWTGEIDVADGWQCGDWTCEGGSTIGIAKYQAAIGVVRKPSIYTTHRQYGDPPEFHSWI